MAGAVKVIGGPELHRALEGLNGDLRDLGPLNAQVASTLAGAVRASAPVLTGTLAGSFGADSGPDRASASTPLGYGGVQNYGSAHTPATHYVDRALEAATPRVLEQYRAGVEGLCRKAEAK